MTADRDQGDDNGGPFWADGELLFRVSGARGEADRLVKVRRPFALVGSGEGADVLLDDRRVSARHVYLHLDFRGVYAVDLVTKAGTRINGEDRMVGWLRPGDWLDVAGHRVELVRIRIDGESVDPPPCDADLLADTSHADLAGVTLEPRRSDDSPWVLGSELVFLGWSASCGIPLKDPAVAWTHGALVRSTRGAYLVDLCGRQTWVEDRPVNGASPLLDGDMITLGATQFTARVEPPARAAGLPALRTGHAPMPLATWVEPASAGLPALPLDPALIPAEAQTALLAWMMGTIQGGQGEVLRRQGEFQVAVTQALRQIQNDNNTLMNAHLHRIENIDRELATLRSELERRHAGPPARVPPNVPPLRIARTTPAAEPSAPGESTPSTTWLLNRVNQLEGENRSAWKDLLGRLGTPKRAT